MLSCSQLGVFYLGALCLQMLFYYFHTSQYASFFEFVLFVLFVRCFVLFFDAILFFNRQSGA
jgi:hypothetical protein